VLPERGEALRLNSIHSIDSEFRSATATGGVEFEAREDRGRGHTESASEAALGNDQIH
jgi:hypothetical protein